MGLRMTSASTRRDSSFEWYTKRVPEDVAELALGRVYVITLPSVGLTPEYTFELTIRKVINRSLRVRDPVAAKRRTVAFTEQLERIFESVRAGLKELTHKEAVALSGEVYRFVVERSEENPGDPETWLAWKAFTWAALEGRVSNPPTISWKEIRDERKEVMDRFDITPSDFSLDIIDRLPPGDNERSLEVRFGTMVTWVLTRNNLEVTPRSRTLLLRQLAEASFDAGWRLKRASQGDYAPDPKALRFPPINKYNKTDAVSLGAVFDRWATETKPEGSTLTTWRSAITHLKNYLKRDIVSSITKKDIISWKDKLVSQQLSPGNINGSYLACLNVILNFSVRNELIGENVARGIKVANKTRPGTGRLPYEDPEVASLLAICAKQVNPARRWIPLLAV